MKGTATLRFARISAQKARLVADMVRGQAVGEAVRILAFLPKKSAPLIRKLIESAVANAEQKTEGLDVDSLRVQTILVDQGPGMRRFRPRAQGRATPVVKKTAHITVTVGTR